MSEASSRRTGVMGILDTVDYGIARLEEVIMAVGVILMAINTIANVIARFVFNNSLAFAEELNSIFILLVTFAGIGYAARHGRHIRMSAIYDAMPRQVRKVLMVVITAVTAAFMLMLAWYSSTCTRRAASTRRWVSRSGCPTCGCRSASSSPASSTC